jgi:hypothetical protein
MAIDILISIITGLVWEHQLLFVNGKLKYENFDIY